MVFSPMEHILFAGSYAGTVIAYDLNSQSVITTFKEHLAVIGAMAVGGSQLLVTGSADTKVKLWDLRSKRSCFTIKNHAKPVTCVALGATWSDSNQPQFIASGSLDAYVNVSEIAMQRLSLQMRDPGSSGVTSVCVQDCDNPARGRRIVSAHMDRHLRVWNIDQ